ncbi:MAG: hypothetical protein H6797_04645 [Candidatus Nomurabacteria bacterium]|nr:MAG: hypothetical protein H6797_04645 [Candidatus Nomurabacteria bacterium]
MSAQSKSKDFTQRIRKLAELLEDIGKVVSSAISTEAQRYSQEDTRQRFRQAKMKLRDASDNAEWIARNELRLVAWRAQSVGKDISALIADFSATSRS